MTTLLLTHEACLAHDPGSHHPESPARLKAVLAALGEPAFAQLARREAPRATLEQIALVHPGDFAKRLLAVVPQQGHAAIDADTVLSPGSGEAALRAAGACIAAVDAVMKGEAQNAFCAVRPPGHHAEPHHAMGFCLFNNVAIAAAHARRTHKIERVAVIDFDVHHGNGTQAAFEQDGTMLYASTHQMPLYPGTGAASERGVGNIVNAPLRPMSGSEEFRKAFANIDPAGARRFPARIRHHLGRLRRASRRSAGAVDVGRGRLCLGHRATRRGREKACTGPNRLFARRRLRSRRPCGLRRGPCRGADGCLARGRRPNGASPLAPKPGALYIGRMIEGSL